MSALKYWDGAAWVVVGGGSSVGNYFNSNVTNQTLSTADVYVVGSNVVVPAGGFKALGQYRCTWDVVKTAGTGGIVVIVRVGTAGTIADTARLTFNAFAAGTSVADAGKFEVVVNWRTVGSGTSAVITGYVNALHQNPSAGLFGGGQYWIPAPISSSGFDSSAATNIGVSFNGSTAFAGTILAVQANLLQ